MGNVWATLFFVLLALAAISSTISMHEAVTSYFVEKRGMSRKHGARLVTLIALVLATAASMSLGDWSKYTLAGMNFFSLLDNFTSIVMLPLLGILTAVFVGWLWKKEDMRAELTAEGGIDKKSYPIIRFLLRWVCPVLVSVVFVFGIIDFVKKQTAQPAEVVTEEVAPETINRDTLRLRIKDLDIREISADKHDFKPMKLTPISVKQDNNNNNN
jgi:SNF family Na+-dependent transporter